MATMGPFIGIKMSLFDFLINKYGLQKEDKREIYYNLFFGAVAGTAAVSAIYPTDLVRRLL